MANFKTHQNGAVMAGIVASITSYSLGMTDIIQSLFVCAIGYFGGLAPDLDHDASVPLKSVFKIISLGIPVILIHKHPELHATLLQIIGSFILLSTFIYFPIRWIFTKLTTHRGIFHSIPAILIFGEIVFLLVGRKMQDLPYQQAMGISASVGYLTHLLLDEYSSLNFNGHRFKPKRSLGTALDLFKPNRTVTLMAYIILGILSWLVLKQH